MKKVVNFLFLPLFLVVLSVGFLSAQGDPVPDSTSKDPWIIKGNWPVPYPTPLVCYNVHEFVKAPFGFGFNIHTAGLLMPHHPPMYGSFIVEFPSFGALFTASILVTNDMFEIVDTLDGYPIYEAYVHFFPDFTSLCPFPVADAEYTLYLSMLDDNVHVPYPIDDYNDPGDIFPAFIFDPASATEYGVKTFCCPDSGMGGQTLLANDEWKDRAESLGAEIGNKEKSHINVEVWPNPFDRQINLQLTNLAAPLEKVEILDVNGRLVYQLDQENLSNRESIGLNTSQLATGVYYLRLRSNGAYISRRIVKLGQ